MANTRVSDLSAGSAVAGTDIIYVVETAGVGGVKKTLTQVQEFVEDELNGAFIGGTNITVTYSDVAGTFTFDFTGTDVTDTDDVPEGATNQYFTVERAQDAVGAMVDTTLVYTDGTPLLVRAALTGAITAAEGSNTTALGSFTKAQLDTAVSDGNVLYVGDITQYTDELAQDAVGAMVDSTLVYVDGTPLLTRAALTGDVTAAQASNTTTIANNAVTYAKIQDVSATNRLLGRFTAGAGDVEEATLGTGLTFSGGALTLDADLTDLITNYVRATSSSPASLNLREDTDNGSSGIAITAPAAIASDKVQTLQDATGTIPLLEADNTWTGAQKFLRTTGYEINLQTDVDTYNPIFSFTDNSPGQARICGFNYLDDGAAVPIQFLGIHNDATPTSNFVQFSVNSNTTQFWGDGGAVFGAATGGTQGAGTVNAVEFFDDGTPVVCMPLNDEMTQADWDALVPDTVVTDFYDLTSVPPRLVKAGYTEKRKHRTAKRHFDMRAEGFDPANPEAYVQRMREDKALPGLITKDEWQARMLGPDLDKISLAERAERTMLALDYLSVAFAAVVDRLKALEEKEEKETV
jgi:hypothetical protein